MKAMNIPNIVLRPPPTASPSFSSTFESAPKMFVPKSEADISTISQQIGVRPAADLVWRPPSPPHIHVPSAPEDEPIEIPPYNGIADNEEERAILTSVLAGNHIYIPGPNEWKYENRRTAQAVLPFLHLGPSAASRDTNYIRANGITLLLAVRNTATAFARLLSGEKIATQMGIAHATVDVTDNQELIAAFPRAVKVINDHLIHLSALRKSGQTQMTGKVLVFCESGNERSAAVLTAYMMSMFNMGMIPAIQFIQSQRFCVAFDDGLKNLLQSYEDINSARSTVVIARSRTPVATHHVPVPTKRRRDDEEEDMDFDMEDDRARFGDRASFAPFVDSQ